MSKLKVKFFVCLTFKFVLISSVLPLLLKSSHPLTQNKNLQNSNKYLPFSNQNTSYEVRRSEVGTLRQQNIRQSTLPMLILALVAGAFVVAFKVFLLLWKVTYYSVIDPYETSGPVPGNVERGIDEYLIGEVITTLTKAFNERSMTNNESEITGALFQGDDWWKRLANFALRDLRKRFET